MAASNESAPTTSLYDMIWDESFWFPADRDHGWKSLENRPDDPNYYPQVSDLNWCLPLSLVLIVIRYLWEMLVVVPIGVRLGVSNKKKEKVENIPQLEAAFKKNKRPDHDTILGLAKQTDMSQRQIEVWLRKRLKLNMLTPMQKFRECSWHLVFYTTYFIYGVTILWDKSYTWKTVDCWEGWPKQNVPNDVYWYYLVELSFYWSLVLTLCTDNKRKDFVEMIVHHVATIILMYFSWMLNFVRDFVEMIVHHVATIILMYFSWMLNFVRVGTLVLIVHDAADTWLALTKMSIYIKNKKATDVFFVFFLLIWIVSRLIIYPFVVLYSTTVEPFEANVMDKSFGSHWFFNFFLYLLQVLHLIWSYLIFRIVYRKVVKGDVEDVRSDSEMSDGDDSDEEELKTSKKNGTKAGINGKPTDNGPVKGDPVVNGYKVTDGNTDADSASKCEGDVNGVGVEKRTEENGIEDSAENGVNGVGERDSGERNGRPGLRNGRPASPSKIPRARKN